MAFLLAVRCAWVYGTVVGGDSSVSIPIIHIVRPPPPLCLSLSLSLCLSLHLPSSRVSSSPFDLIFPPYSIQ